MPDKQEMKNINESTDTMCDMKTLFYLSNGIPLTGEELGWFSHSILPTQQRRSSRSLTHFVLKELFIYLYIIVC